MNIKILVIAAPSTARCTVLIAMKISAAVENDSGDQARGNPLTEHVPDHALINPQQEQAVTASAIVTVVVVRVPVLFHATVGEAEAETGKEIASESETQGLLLAFSVLSLLMRCSGAVVVGASVTERMLMKDLTARITRTGRSFSSFYCHQLF